MIRRLVRYRGIHPLRRCRRCHRFRLCHRQMMGWMLGRLCHRYRLCHHFRLRRRCRHFPSVFRRYRRFHQLRHRCRLRLRRQRQLRIRLRLENQ